MAVNKNTIATPALVDSALDIAMETRVFDFVECASRDQGRAKLDELRAAMRRNLDLSAYESPDRKWYQRASAEYMAFIYDVTFYDRANKRYRIEECIEDGRREFGGFDLIVLWHSYPRLGVDERNQFDLYRDMPGGLAGIRDLVDRAHTMGVRVLLNYNPWDTSTRAEENGHGAALGDIAHAVGADGVFLDTMATFDKAESGFRETLEARNPHLVYDPEAMVGPSNVHVVTGSWQQTMSFEPPHIITVRWLEPRFSMRGIRRTSNDRTWHIHTNFFTGCGQVIWENIFGWWNPWTESERALFRRCNTILHAYADAFLDHDWQPYVPTLCAEVYAHEWHDHTTTVYTLLNTGTEIAEGALLSVHLPADEYRFINIWDGSEVAVSEQDGRSVLSFAIAPRSSCCIVAAPRTEAKLLPLVAPQAKPPQTIAESLACPGYLGLVSPQKTHEFPIDHQTRCSLDAYQPRPVAPTAPADPGDAPEGMIAVDGGRFVMLVRHSEDAAMEGACYGEVAAPRPINHPDFGPGFPAQSADHPPQYFWMKPFLIDRTEVTNEEFRRFLADTHYVPHDPTNFLRHWAKPAAEAERPWKWEIPAGGGRHPVVWVDLDDARAYAAWAEKRLPTEPEWQYAAQYTSDGLHRRRWPWGDAFERTRCNTDSAGTTPVDAYPAGASSLGILDLCGNVWEWTESERHDGHTRYAILRGGSYFRAEGSVWYRAGGAQPNDVHTKFLLMYPGLDRCATVGFRCVKDIKANG